MSLLNPSLPLVERLRLRWRRDPEICAIDIEAADEIERLRAENLQYREIIDGYSRTGYTVMRAQLTDTAAFLDRIAGRLDVGDLNQLVADCREMARRLRGKI